jgi:hypothetical protein
LRRLLTICIISPYGEEEAWLPRWLRGVLTRIHGLAEARKVRFTHKALRELAALGLGLDQDDCCELLQNLSAADFADRIKSEITDEWMFVFKPRGAGMGLYVKLILRGNCVIVSFHEEATEDGNEGSA